MSSRSASMWFVALLSTLLMVIVSIARGDLPCDLEYGEHCPSGRYQSNERDSLSFFLYVADYLLTYLLADLCKSDHKLLPFLLFFHSFVTRIGLGCG